MDFANQHEQDQHYKDIGFYFERDYEMPDLTDKEYNTLGNLANYAKKMEPKDDFLKTLSESTDFWYIIRAYRIYGRKLIDFIEDLKKKGESDIPDDNLIKKLVLHATYHSQKNNLISVFDCETREDKAYKEDGKTPKEGFIRLYAK